jgi:MFS family permease
MADAPPLTAKPSSGFRSLAHNRDFTLLWVGQTISELGARASTFVFPILAFALTDSTVAAAAVEMLFLFGLAATMLPAGVLADRLDRRMLMRTSAALGAILYASLAVAGALGALTIEHLLIVAPLTGLTTGLFAPAETSAIRTVVSPEEMPAALSQQQARQHVASLLGAPLGGALYSLARWAPFVLNTLSYAVAWVLLGRIRTDLSPATTDEPRSHPARELTEGLRFTVGVPFLRVMLLWSPLANLTANALFFLAILRLVREGTPAGAIALAEVAAGVAGILGAAIAPWLIARIPTGWIIIGAGWSMVPLAVPIALWPTVPVVAGALALIMVLNPAGNAGVGAYRIALTPPALTGRVQSAMMFTAMTTMPLAPVLAGGLLGLLGGRDGGLAIAVLLALAVLVPTCSRVVRQVPRPELWSAHQGGTNVTSWPPH